MLSAGGVWLQGEFGCEEGGFGQGGEGGRGYFIHLAINCTTTWCFALKGLRTTRVKFSFDASWKVGK